MHHSRNSNSKSHFFVRQLRKHFVPHESNNHHPHILRSASFAGFSFLIVLVFAFSFLQIVAVQKTNFLSFVYPDALVQMLNEDRETYDLSSLTVNPVLERVAQAKANDMAEKGYFAHNSPEGKTPWYWFSKAGYDYQYAGENLAINFSDSADANNAWMNSPTHRANILNNKFTEVGIATAKGVYQGKETIFVAQVFGTPRLAGNPGSSQTLASAKTQEIGEVKPAAKAIEQTTASNLANQIVSKPVAVDEPQVSGANTNNTKGEVAGIEIDKETKSTFVAVSRPVIDAKNQQVVEPTPAPKTNSEINAGAELKSMVSITPEKVLTNPKRTMALAYSLIAGIILFALVAMFSIERHRQHHKPYIYGIMLLLFMLSLLIFFQSYISTSGAIAIPSTTNSDTIQV